MLRALCLATLLVHAASAQLTVLSWNIHGFGPVASDEAGRAALAAARAESSTLELFAQAVRASGADVVALQEVASESRLQELARALGMHAAYFPGGWKGDGWEEGISGGLLSRFPLLEVEDRPGLAPYGEGSEDFSRCFGRALIEVRGERVAVYAAHMLPSWENTESVRLAEIAAVERAARADLLRAHSVIVLGDMNHAPATVEARAWEAAGLRDAFALVGRGEGRSCPSLEPTERIDYCFVAGPLAARLQECGELSEGRFGADEGFALSDHLPVRARFGALDWPEPEQRAERAALPELLRTESGESIESAAHWWALRRPELLELVQREMYGVAPPAPVLRPRVVQRDALLLDGACRLHEVELAFEGLGPDAPTILLALFLPAASEGPAPIFLGLNKCGNHTLVADPAVRQRLWPWQAEDCAKEDFLGRGARASTWVLPELIERGYGLASFCVTDLDPDRHEPGEGIQAHYPQAEVPEEQRWGTIAAWAWGVSRAIDHLVLEPGVDPERIALIGHSRRGKASLLAAALDPRVGLVVPHQSGTGGMALSRDNNREKVERITRIFPHWFAPRFARYSDREALLPIDQHALVALVAPRAVFDTEGLQDTWANFHAALRNLRAASAVYELLGVPGVRGEGLLTDADAIDTAELGRLQQLRLDKEHELDLEYWARILDFADRTFAR